MRFVYDVREGQEVRLYDCPLCQDVKHIAVPAQGVEWDEVSLYCAGPMVSILCPDCSTEEEQINRASLLERCHARRVPIDGRFIEVARRYRRNRLTMEERKRLAEEYRRARMNFMAQVSRNSAIAKGYKSDFDVSEEKEQDE